MDATAPEGDGGLQELVKEGCPDTLFFSRLLAPDLEGFPNTVQEQNLLGGSCIPDARF